MHLFGLTENRDTFFGVAFITTLNTSRKLDISENGSNGSYHEHAIVALFPVILRNGVFLSADLRNLACNKILEKFIICL